MGSHQHQISLAFSTVSGNENQELMTQSFGVERERNGENLRFMRIPSITFIVERLFLVVRQRTTTTQGRVICMGNTDSWPPSKKNANTHVVRPIDLRHCVVPVLFYPHLTCIEFCVIDAAQINDSSLANLMSRNVAAFLVWNKGKK